MSIIRRRRYYHYKNTLVALRIDEWLEGRRNRQTDGNREEKVECEIGDSIYNLRSSFSSGPPAIMK